MTAVNLQHIVCHAARHVTDVDKDTYLASAALAYARRGRQVFPLKPRDKTPLTPHGFKDASTDPDTIDSW